MGPRQSRVDTAQDSGWRPTGLPVTWLVHARPCRSGDGGWVPLSHITLLLEAVGCFTSRLGWHHSPRQTPGLALLTADFLSPRDDKQVLGPPARQGSGTMPHKHEGGW